MLGVVATSDDTHATTAASPVSACRPPLTHLYENRVQLLHRALRVGHNVPVANAGHRNDGPVVAARVLREHVARTR